MACEACYNVFSCLSVVLFPSAISTQIRPLKIIIKLGNKPVTKQLDQWVQASPRFVSSNNALLRNPPLLEIREKRCLVPVSPCLVSVVTLFAWNHAKNLAAAMKKVTMAAAKMDPAERSYSIETNTGRYAWSWTYTRCRACLTQCYRHWSNVCSETILVRRLI